MPKNRNNNNHKNKKKNDDDDYDQARQLTHNYVQNIVYVQMHVYVDMMSNWIETRMNNKKKTTITIVIMLRDSISYILQWLTINWKLLVWIHRCNVSRCVLQLNMANEWDRPKMLLTCSCPKIAKIMQTKRTLTLHA